MKDNEILTFEILRGATHDGPGFRTTVFTKGCPLACCWCQNPESLNSKQEVWYEQRKCIGCLECVRACPVNALAGSSTGIDINRDRCAACGKCTDICPAKALSPVGTLYTAENLMHEILKDSAYYSQSGGGVTFSGGEPLLYAGFLTDFCKSLKAKAIHVAIDTCGYVPRDNLMRVLPHIDMLLYDLKLIDPLKHKEFTGMDNGLILDNLKAAVEYIRKSNKSAPGRYELALWVRTPLIPEATANADNIAQIGEFLAKHTRDVTQRWELCAFNPLCETKYIKMQRAWHYKGHAALGEGEANKLLDVAREYSIVNTVLTGILA